MSKARPAGGGDRYCRGRVYALPECLPADAVEAGGQLGEAWCRTVCADASVCYLTTLDGDRPAVACESCVTVGRRPEGLEARARNAREPALGRFLAQSASLEAAAVYAFRR
ncbi:MAG TPA: hypothetical protein VNG33_09275, partial [Polyangiaceae bacterium]|nr:hypothetical protein [Polyangiaceae bacterium]